MHFAKSSNVQYPHYKVDGLPDHGSYTTDTLPNLIFLYQSNTVVLEKNLNI